MTATTSFFVFCGLCAVVENMMRFFLWLDRPQKRSRRTAH